VNADFINPFLSSVSNVLATMAQTESQPGQLALKQSATACGDVSGIIGMSGPQGKGSFAISFSEELVLAITQRMLGEEHTEIDNTVTDLVGEVTNMAIGGAKQLLADTGYDFGLASPVVVRGKDHRIDHHSKVATLLIPFSSDAGEFYIEVNFEPSQLNSLAPARP